MLNGGVMYLKKSLLSLATAGCLCSSTALAWAEPPQAQPAPSIAADETLVDKVIPGVIKSIAKPHYYMSGSCFDIYTGSMLTRGRDSLPLTRQPTAEDLSELSAEVREEFLGTLPLAELREMAETLWGYANAQP
jgi:hypothetical protein